jgi:phospholipase C
MNIRFKRNWKVKIAACAPLLALFASDIGTPAHAGPGTDNPANHMDTATPIKHVIIIVGENRSFDHVFATYAPRHRNERVLNLL